MFKRRANADCPPTISTAREMAALSIPESNHSGGIVVNYCGLPAPNGPCSVVSMGMGRNVKRRREEFNWTQADLASRSGVNQQTISALEKRDSKTSEYLLPLATTLNLRPDELLSGNWGVAVREPATLYTPEDQAMNVQKEVAELVAAWMALPENERDEFKRELEVRSLKYRKRVPDKQMENYGKKAKTKAGTQ